MTFLSSLFIGSSQDIFKGGFWHISSRIIICFALSYLWSCGSAKQPSQTSVNIVSKYETNSPIKIKHTVTLKDNQYTIYLSLNVRRLRSEKTTEAFFKNIALGYMQKQAYVSPPLVNIDSIPFNELNVKKVGEVYLCKFNITKTSSFPPYLIVKARDKRTDFEINEDIILETNGQSNYGSQLLFNMQDSTPVFSSYAIAGVPYQLIDDAPKSFFVNIIKEEFPPAPAPMSSPSKPVNKKIGIDTVFSIKSNETVTFDTAGLYLIQADTSTSTGIGFRIEKNKYPKYTKISSLLKPLIYISTTEEIKTLNKNADPKKALDNYWLKLAGNANDAKRIIKIYYDRVEAANEKFTSYKEGWKTDMGMVFIIFGEPSQVFRNDDREEWIFEKSEGMSQVKFTFVKVKNIYSNNHYELIRNPEYEEFWYNKVDLWRKGTPGI